MQSQQSDCNLSNLTAISAIRLKRFRNLHIHLVIPWRLSQTANSAIRLQSQQSDCNLSNPTAISAIQLQSPQSDCKSSSTYIYSWSIPRCLSQNAISTIRLQKAPQHTYTLGHPTASQSDCNISNQTAIFTITLQSPQLNCNIHNQTAMQEDCSLIAEIALWLWRLHTDC